jgi:hypothetical protein
MSRVAPIDAGKAACVVAYLMNSGFAASKVNQFAAHVPWNGPVIERSDAFDDKPSSDIALISGSGSPRLLFADAVIDGFQVS